MGLKPKKEMLHGYFLKSQVCLLLGAGLVYVQSKFHQKTADQQTARDEPANYPVFGLITDYIVKKIANKKD
jgi:hypothetical protein